MLVGPPSEVIRWIDRCRGLMVHTAQAGFVPQLQLLEEKASPISPTWGFRGGSVLQNLPANAEDMGPIPGSGRSPGEGNGNPLPVFLPGESHGQRSPTGDCPWDCKTVRHNLVTKTMTKTFPCVPQSLLQPSTLRDFHK